MSATKSLILAAIVGLGGCAETRERPDSWKETAAEQVLRAEGVKSYAAAATRRSETAARLTSAWARANYYDVSHAQVGYVKVLDVFGRAVWQWNVAGVSLGRGLRFDAVLLTQKDSGVVELYERGRHYVVAE